MVAILERLTPGSGEAGDSATATGSGQCSCIRIDLGSSG
jgi:hypothetical protein